MKKNIISVFVTLVLFSNLLPAQNITNTLGSTGIFKIKDGTTEYFTLTQATGQVNILKTLKLENTTGSGIGVIYKGTTSFLHNYKATGTAGSNTFLGLSSGNFSMLGNFSGYSSYNVGIGDSVLKNISTSSKNTAIGFSSQVNNENGNDNTSLGYLSLYNLTDGHENTAIGSSSLYSNQGYYNTAVGHRSSYKNFSGIFNVAVGCSTLFYNASGDCNIGIGAKVLVYSTGSYNTAIGYNSGSLVSSGTNLVLIGSESEPSTGSAINQVTLGNSQITSLRCNVQSITSLSDARDKTEIVDLPLGLEFISKLKPRKFNWDKREWYDDNIPDGTRMQETPTAGFIAQELDELQRSENADWLNLVLKDNPGKWEATYGNLLPVMVKAIQELKKENDELKSQIETLSRVNERLAVIEQLLLESNSGITVNTAGK